jgi:prepilin-type N-terminal cleavage/methylation domain-containing protein
MLLRSFTKGFTIFEVLIVIGISTVLLALALPVGFRFYQFQVADETTTGILSALRNAESRSRLGMEGDTFGVKLLPDSYVLFQGDSYVARVVSHDETFPLPPGTSIESAGDEIVFARVTGIPSATGTIAITLYDRTHEIEVNDAGVISDVN